MYELTKTLSLFVYPFGLFFLLAALALGLRLLGRLRGALGLAVFSVVWLWVWSMPVTSEHLRHVLESRYANLPADQAPLADAIVVLGGAFRGDAAWPYPSAGGNVDRYWHGARLYHAGRAPLIILSGGRHPRRPDNPSEAESGARFLIDMGVPAAVLLLDNQSRTTYEHIRYITPDPGPAGHRAPAAGDLGHPHAPRRGSVPPSRAGRCTGGNGVWCLKRSGYQPPTLPAQRDRLVRQHPGGA